MQRNNRTQELLDLIQEEASEIIQEVSKVRRFGEDFRARGGQDPTAHKKLQREVWDLQILLGMLETDGYLETYPTTDYVVSKIERLKTWTNLYEEKR